MNVPIGILYILLSVLFCALLFLPSDRMTERRRKILFTALGGAALLPVLVKGVFCFSPVLEAKILPVAWWGLVQRDFWLPFSILFFALASHLLSRSKRRAIFVFLGLLLVIMTQRVYWRLTPPPSYQYKGTVDAKGVCRQTSHYTCTAAASVTLLHGHGIRSTEGEMASLSGIIPGGGASHHQAAYGLARKLRKEGRTEEVRILKPGVNGLDQIPVPFLAGIKWGFLVDHMVCVLRVDVNFVEMGDPVQGWVAMDRADFEADWKGLAIVIAHPD
ncbi:MAG: cysteine peptidase family C39 domain-containing protein [Planctomycetota bacterium]|jgi:hypothetical protein